DQLLQGTDKQDKLKQQKKLKEKEKEKDKHLIKEERLKDQNVENQQNSQSPNRQGAKITHIHPLVDYSSLKAALAGGTATEDNIRILVSRSNALALVLIRAVYKQLFLMYFSYDREILTAMLTLRALYDGEMISYDEYRFAMDEKYLRIDSQQNIDEQELDNLDLEFGSIAPDVNTPKTAFTSQQISQSIFGS
ncbi:MAG: hypothetical protein EZS28_055770, partial [Streblomastix strix]